MSKKENLPKNRRKTKTLTHAKPSIPGMQYESPFASELGENKTFLYSIVVQSFKCQPMPSNFEFHVEEYDVLEEGQVIGISRSGQVLYWEQGTVVARG